MMLLQGQGGGGGGEGKRGVGGREVGEHRHASEQYGRENCRNAVELYYDNNINKKKKKNSNNSDDDDDDDRDDDYDSYHHHHHCRHPKLPKHV